MDLVDEFLECLDGHQQPEEESLTTPCATTEQQVSFSPAPPSIPPPSSNEQEFPSSSIPEQRDFPFSDTVTSSDTRDILQKGTISYTEILRLRINVSLI